MGSSGSRRQSMKRKRIAKIIVIEVVVLLLLLGAYFVFAKTDIFKKDASNQVGQNKDNDQSNDVIEPEEEKLSPEEQAAKEEQERLVKEEEERKELVAQAEKMVLSYDYDGAIALLKEYKGSQGGYEVYTSLANAVASIEETVAGLLPYGGVYQSAAEVNHIFFHSLIADNSKAFDDEYTSIGYNQYMTTIYEFNKMMEIMYQDGYVLASMHDLVAPVEQEDGSIKYVDQKMMLPPGKKPFVISQDDVNYYDYMKEDGFAHRMVIGEDGRATTEMDLEDGSSVIGDFDMVPLLDKFIDQHPDFSYKGAKATLAITGYEGVLGYRTNDPTSPTYASDVEEAKKVAEALKADGWEFASHSWGHRNSTEASDNFFIQDTQRWLDEVGSILGETDLYIFPYGADIEITMGHYKGAKYDFLYENGFRWFSGVDKKPWMQIWPEYVRMSRRPLDGMAMLQFPERLQDLFTIEEVIDPERPALNW